MNAETGQALAMLITTTVGGLQLNAKAGRQRGSFEMAFESTTFGNITLGLPSNQSTSKYPGMIKAVNLTPANYLKNGMNLRSVEAIFTRAEADS